MPKVTIKDGKMLIELDMQSPRPSASGKTEVVATTNGNVATEAKLPDGRTIVVGANAYVKPKVAA